MIIIIIIDVIKYQDQLCSILRDLWCPKHLQCSLTFDWDFSGFHMNWTLSGGCLIHRLEIKRRDPSAAGIDPIVRMAVPLRRRSHPRADSIDGNAGCNTPIAIANWRINGEVDQTVARWRIRTAATESNSIIKWT